MNVLSVRMKKPNSTKKPSRVGSSFDDFLKENGIYEEVTEQAIVRVLARKSGQSGRAD
jgi:antitoxin HicB